MIIHINKDNFKEVISNNPKIIVDFWAPWCNPCRMLGSVLEGLEDELVIGKVNVDEEMELSTIFNVTNIPLLIMFKDGKPTNKIVGFCTETQIRALYNE